MWIRGVDISQVIAVSIVMQIVNKEHLMLICIGQAASAGNLFIRGKRGSEAGIGVIALARLNNQRAGSNQGVEV